MRVSIFGMSYVGLTFGACLASKGFKVIGVDVDEKKVSLINSGRPPFYEPGLEKLLMRAVKDELLIVTTDSQKAVLETDLSFISVGTPSLPDGSSDLSQLKSALTSIGKALKEKGSWHLITIRSTIPPGTCDNLAIPILEGASGKRAGKGFGLCMNPEFLREGSAVQDVFNPDKVVIGEYDKRSGDALESLYKKFHKDELPPIIRTSLVNAELIKYANNSFLATKISFINTIANVCERLPGADVEIIAKAIGLDPRISPLFLRAGVGFGGSCFPKDVKALIAKAKELGYEAKLLRAVLEVNEEQPRRAVELAKMLIGNLKGKRIAILGLAFKPNTDDLREAPSIKIINHLLAEGAEVIAYDPVATEKARSMLGDATKYASNVKECLKKADCAILVTEWDEFKALKPEDFVKLMRFPALVDGRRVYEPKPFMGKVRYAGIGYGLNEDPKRYINPAVAVNALITKDGRVLLVKRAKEPYKDLWSLPGGYLEYNETIEDGLRREICEETGLLVKPTNIIGIYSDPLRHPEKHVIAIAYEAVIEGGELKPGKEIDEIKFFGLNELPGLAFDHGKMIKDYLKRAEIRKA